MSEPVDSCSLILPVATAGQLATECWRLGRLKKAACIVDDDRLALDRAVRRLNEILNSVGLQIIDFAGTAYDPGIVPEVIDVQIDSTFPTGTSLIDETVLPTVTWGNKVIQVGQIIVKQAPAGTQITEEKA